MNYSCEISCSHTSEMFTVDKPKICMLYTCTVWHHHHRCPSDSTNNCNVFISFCSSFFVSFIQTDTLVKMSFRSRENRKMETQRSSVLHLFVLRLKCFHHGHALKRDLLGPQNLSPVQNERFSAYCTHKLYNFGLPKPFTQDRSWRRKW